MDTKQNARIALVTGGTSGIGLSIVRALAASGAFVHFVGTNRDKGQRIAAELEAAGQRGRFLRADLSSMRAVDKLARRLAGELERLDTLVNVAGVVLPQRQETVDGFETTLAVDHLSALLLSRELRPLLAKGERPRIANVSGPRRQMLKPLLDFDDLQLTQGYSFLRAVSQGLHAKTVMTQLLAERFAEDGIDVNAFDAGAVRSELSRNLAFPMNLLLRFVQLFMPRVSKTGIHVSTSEALSGITGQFFYGRERVSIAFDGDYARRLWDASEAMLASALGEELSSPPAAPRAPR